MFTRNRITIILMVAVLSTLVSHQRGLFLPDAVIAGECNLTSFKSSENKVQLIELYTSEGCSSCPPADKWVSSLRNDKNLGKTFFPVKFHVDYWDYLGWKDQLAKSEYTQRQRRYAREWRARNVYTPGFALNGSEWRAWRLLRPPNASSEKVGILKAVNKNGIFHIEYSGKKNASLRLNFAVVGNGIEHKIKAGENSGKILKHNFSVLHFENMKFNNKMTVSIPQVKHKAPEKMVVFWLNQSNSQKPIQVVSGCIN